MLRRDQPGAGLTGLELIHAHMLPHGIITRELSDLRVVLAGLSKVGDVSPVRVLENKGGEVFCPYPSNRPNILLVSGHITQWFWPPVPRLTFFHQST